MTRPVPTPGGVVLVVIEKYDVVPVPFPQTTVITAPVAVALIVMLPTVSLIENAPAEVRLSVLPEATVVAAPEVRLICSAVDVIVTFPVVAVALTPVCAVKATAPVLDDRDAAPADVAVRVPDAAVVMLPPAHVTLDAVGAVPSEIAAGVPPPVALNRINWLPPAVGPGSPTGTGPSAR